MFNLFFMRDRMVMVGLLILGLFTVVAGFVSGRSTVQYALSTDARQASAAWVERVERELQLLDASGIGEVAGRRITVTAPELLRKLQNPPLEFGASRTKIAPSARQVTGLLAGVDRIFSGWIRGITELLDSENHVSRVIDFALLDRTGTPILRSTNFTPAALASILTDDTFRADFHKALGMRSTRVVEDLRTAGHVSADFRKMILVPVIDSLTISRVYALEIDQSTAATMSKVALVAASVMTSLLIVLGYSIPAAVAFRRIRERWKAEDQIRFLAMHDPLTGLSNRVQMQHRLEQGVARAKRSQNLLAVMCLDLDRFKDVNDTLGHKAGDMLLKETANRLLECVRETDVVARLGGDEFAIIAEDIDDPNDTIPIARRICDSLSRTFEIDGHTISTSASVGITFSPNEGTDADTLLNNADLALYRAKHDGRNTFRFFEPEMDRTVQDRRAMSSDLRRALRNDELTIHYQPQFDLRTGQLTGYEALARWQHSERGDVPPSVFIPIAEEMGLIGILGEWVLQEACGYALGWPHDTTLSVNLSPAQFRSHDIGATITRVLDETGFPASRLLLEITENLLLKNTEETIETLKKLTDIGVSLVLDDFGTGYSSLSYLTRFPVRKIKIDRSFIDLIDAEPERSSIVSTIIGLGKSLNVTITAEGVETNAQADYLRRLGCNEVQGFLFGRPRPEILPERPQVLPVPDDPAQAIVAAPGAPVLGVPVSAAPPQPAQMPADAPARAVQDMSQARVPDAPGEASSAPASEPAPLAEPLPEYARKMLNVV